MAITFLQTTSATWGAGNTNLAASFSSNVANGSLIVAAVFQYGNGGATSVITDSQGNTWSAAAPIADAGGRSVELFYTVTSAAGAFTAHLNAPNSSAALAYAIAEFSGVATPSPEDGSGVTVTGSNGSISIGLTTTQNNDLFIAAADKESDGVNPALAAGLGFTSIYTASPLDPVCFEYQPDAGTAGSKTATFTNPTTANVYLGAAAAFKIAGGGGGTPIKRLLMLGAG